MPNVLLTLALPLAALASLSALMAAFAWGRFGRGTWRVEEAMWKNEPWFVGYLGPLVLAALVLVPLVLAVTWRDRSGDFARLSGEGRPPAPLGP